MFEGRGPRPTDDGRPRGSWSVAGGLVVLLALAGCSAVVDVAAGAFGGGEVGGAVDAHVVYRARPDCPAVLARTLDNGYTVLTPLEALAAPGAPPFGADAVEDTGVFEGPVREGEVVFRYVPPDASETWAAGPVDVLAEVAAVRLTQAEGSALLLDRCGPPPADAPAPRRDAPAPRRDE